MRLLHEGDLRRCFRDSGSVTYMSTLPAPQLGLGGLRHLALILRPCISSFVQSLSAFDSNVREWHFVQHSLNTSTLPLIPLYKCKKPTPENREWASRMGSSSYILSY